ncbi:hypothetical protein ACWGKU_20465 [Kitasatospora sp. NPDC054768]
MTTPTSRPTLQLGLLASGWADTLQETVHTAVALERYRADAAALGLADRADALLAEARGGAVGSTSTAEHLAAARQLLYAEVIDGGRAA